MESDKSLNEATPLSEQVKDASNALEWDDAITSTTSDKSAEAMDVDADFFGAAELGIHVSPEKITENVEDIVQDLENLLGTSSGINYDFSKDKVNSSDEIVSSNQLQSAIGEGNSTAPVEDLITDNLEGPETNAAKTNDTFQASDLTPESCSTEGCFTKKDNVEIQINEVSTDTPTVNTPGTDLSNDTMVSSNTSGLTLTSTNAEDYEPEGNIEPVQQGGILNLPERSPEEKTDETITTTSANTGLSASATTFVSHKEEIQADLNILVDNNLVETSEPITNIENTPEDDSTTVSSILDNPSDNMNSNLELVTEDLHTSNNDDLVETSSSACYISSTGTIEDTNALNVEDLKEIVSNPMNTADTIPNSENDVPLLNVINETVLQVQDNEIKAIADIRTENQDNEIIAHDQLECQSKNEIISNEWVPESAVDQTTDSIQEVAEDNRNNECESTNDMNDDSSQSEAEKPIHNDDVPHHDSITNSDNNKGNSGVNEDEIDKVDTQNEIHKKSELDEGRDSINQAIQQTQEDIVVQSSSVTNDEELNCLSDTNVTENILENKVEYDSTFISNNEGVIQEGDLPEEEVDKFLTPVEINTGQVFANEEIQESKLEGSNNQAMIQNEDEVDASQNTELIPETIPVGQVFTNEEIQESNFEDSDNQAVIQNEDVDGRQNTECQSTDVTKKEDINCLPDNNQSELEKQLLYNECQLSIISNSEGIEDNNLQKEVEATSETDSITGKVFANEEDQINEIVPQPQVELTETQNTELQLNTITNSEEESCSNKEIIQGDVEHQNDTEGDAQDKIINESQSSTIIDCATSELNPLTDSSSNILVQDNKFKGVATSSAEEFQVETPFCIVAESTDKLCNDENLTQESLGCEIDNVLQPSIATAISDTYLTESTNLEEVNAELRSSEDTQEASIEDANIVDGDTEVIHVLPEGNSDSNVSLTTEEQLHETPHITVEMVEEKSDFECPKASIVECDNTSLDNIVNTNEMVSDEPVEDVEIKRIEPALEQSQLIPVSSETELLSNVVEPSPLSESSDENDTEIPEISTGVTESFDNDVKADLNQDIHQSNQAAFVENVSNTSEVTGEILKEDDNAVGNVIDCDLNKQEICGSEADSKTLCSNVSFNLLGVTQDSEAAPSLDLVFNVADDASTTTAMDAAVNSIMFEDVDTLAEEEAVDSTVQLNVSTESDSAVKALISAELSVQSNTIDYSAAFSTVSSFNKPSANTTSKIFEPSVIELNCAVASILGENSNSGVSELEFEVVPTAIVRKPLDENDAMDSPTTSYESNVPSNVEQPIPSTFMETQTTENTSEELVTQSNIEDAVHESESVEDGSIALSTQSNIHITEGEAVTVGSISLPTCTIDKPNEGVLQPVELGKPLVVQVEDGSVEPVDNSVTSTQLEKPEINEVASPESQKNMSSLKITIGKDKNLHSILKIYDPNEAQTLKEEPVIPKITIKPILSPVASQSSPKLTIKPIKPPESCSPKITIKPVLKAEAVSPIKITLRPTKTTPTSPGSQMWTTDSGETSHHSPKITIKPIVKPDENAEKRVIDLVKPGRKSVEEGQEHLEEMRSSPKLIIKQIKSPEEERSSPKITIKPIVKTQEELQYAEDKAKMSTKNVAKSESCHSPKITIKPIIKPEDSAPTTEEIHSPRITIKPIIKPENEPATSPLLISELSKLQEDLRERGTEICSVPPFKLNIKPIVKPEESNAPVEGSQEKQVIKSPEQVAPSHSIISALLQNDLKEHQSDLSSNNPVKINIKPVVKSPETSILQSFLKSGELPKKADELIDFEDQIKPGRIILKIAKPTRRGRSSVAQNERLSPLKLKLEKEHANPSSKRSVSTEWGTNSKHFKSDLPAYPSYSRDDTLNQEFQKLPEANVVNDEVNDPLAEIPIFEISSKSKPETMQISSTVGLPPAPRKRGRPRKVPLQVREEFKDSREEVPPLHTDDSLDPIKPKRSYRGGSRAGVGRTRKPRGSRGRRGGGSPRGTRSRKSKESRLSTLGLFPEPMLIDSERTDTDTKDGEFKPVPLPSEIGNNREVVIYEEETRMSAENSSRAQTPAKQVLSSTEVIDESQSSVQSNATTESGEKIPKSRKSRIEVHHEPEGEVLSADKLAEYSWGGGGPYMLQEQVAQFLGIKSFKRKYPGIQRRPVDMQERDFIRESCLASEGMCDMGLTAVKSEDILDIMYTDFQHKYEEYCKFQRDRQAKDVSNKQKALSLAASQEKNKIDMVEQAVQSAQQWNANFNKTRREQRRACMDLQTFTVHYPKGRMKQINKAPIGNYPLSLVPGQYSDYYKKYTPRELTKLPLNTVGSGSNVDADDSPSDGSGSDSDSSSSDSDSSSSESSDDCKMCNTRQAVTKKQLVR